MKKTFKEYFEVYADGFRYSKERVPGFYKGLKERLEKKGFVVYFNVALKGTPYLRVGRTKEDLYNIQYFGSTKTFKVFNKDRKSALLHWNAVILDDKGKKVQAKIDDFVSLLEEKIK